MNLYLYQSFFSNKSFDDLGKSWGQVLILEFIKLLVEEFNYQEIGKSRSLFLHQNSKRTNNNILGSMVVNQLTNKPLYAGVVLSAILCSQSLPGEIRSRTIGELFFLFMMRFRYHAMQPGLLLELLKSTMKNFCSFRRQSQRATHLL